jgi:hypothetical protein
MALPFIFSHQNTKFNSPSPINGEGMWGMVSPIEWEENREGIRLTKEIPFHNL